MAKNHLFVRDDVLPSYWANAIQEFISTLAANLRVSRFNATTVEVVAGAADAQVAVGIDGLWRLRSATVQRAHPAGAAGVYGVFAVAKAEDIDAIPDPYTDNTDYSFDLRVEAPGAEPTIVPGTVDAFRKIGETVWDGAAIRFVRSLQSDGRFEAPAITGEESAPLKIIRGIVLSGGATLEGSGFASSRLSTGKFLVNFTTDFSDLPSVAPTLLTSSQGWTATLENLVAGQTEVWISAANVFVDASFSFIAVGPA